MSHRDLDDIAELRRRLGALDIRIAAARRAAVVDLGDIAEMRRNRGELAAHLARYEEGRPT